MSTSPSSTARRGAVPPMAHCWQCESDIRPLTSPASQELSCPLCGGSFVEILQEQDEHHANDDGEQQQQQQGAASGNPFGGILGGLFQSVLAGAAQQAAQQRQPQSQPQAQAQQPGFQYGGQASFGPIRIQYGTTTLGGAGPSTARRTVIGGVRGSQPQTLSSFLDNTLANQRGGNGGGSSPFSDGNIGRTPDLGPHHDQHVHDDGMGGAGGAADGRFFNWDNPDRPTNDSDNNPADPSGHGTAQQEQHQQPLPPQFEAMRSIFANLFGGMPRPAGAGAGAGSDTHTAADAFGLPLGMFAEFFGGGASNGRWGDYALTQEGLDNIITQLMEQTNQGHGPAPASDEAIARLERFDRSNRVRLAKAKNTECATCKEDFIPNPSSPPTADQAQRNEHDDPADAVPNEPDEQENAMVGLPCNHVFHEGCIVDWLKINGSCPICRAPIEPDASAAGQGGGRGSGTEGGGGGGSHDSDQAQQATPSSSPSAGPSTSGASSSPHERTASQGQTADRTSQGDSSSQTNQNRGGLPMRLFANLASSALRQHAAAARNAAGPSTSTSTSGSGPGWQASTMPSDVGVGVGVGVGAEASAIPMPGGWQPSPARFSPSSPLPTQDSDGGPSNATSTWGAAGTARQPEPGPEPGHEPGHEQEPSPEERRRILREATEARLQGRRRGGDEAQSPSPFGHPTADADGELD